MPPKAKFSKEEIINAALTVVRTRGAQALTARALGAELNSSARPIFTTFQNMEEVQKEVFKAACDLFEKCQREYMTNGKYPPVQADGLSYIHFAKEETELFKLLYMRNRSKEEEKNVLTEPNEIIKIIQKDTGLSFEKALQLDLEMWIYAHGIATMIATNYSDWDWDTICTMLTDAYEGLKHRFQCS